MQPGSSIHSHQFAGKSVIFILVLTAGPLPAHTLPPKRSGLRAYGGEGRGRACACAGARSEHRPELVHICFAGFLFWVKKREPCHAIAPRVVADGRAGDCMEPAESLCLGGLYTGSLPCRLLDSTRNGTRQVSV